MQNSYVLTIDLGSSKLRVSLHPKEKPWLIVETLAKKYRVYKPLDPNSFSSHFSEAELWQRVSSVVSQISKKVRKEEIIAISVTSQRGGFVLLDSQGKTIHVAPNTDLRAVFEGIKIDQDYGTTLYGLTGHVPAFFFAPSKVQWWKNNHPRIAKRISKASSLGSWLTYKLSGEISIVPTDLSELGLLDPGTMDLPYQILKSLEFDKELIPNVLPEGTSVGKIKNSVADLLGVSNQAEIFLAGPDTHTSILSMGNIHSGEGGVVAGWSGPVHLTTQRPIFDKLHRTITGPSLFPKSFYLEANSGAIGGTLEVIKTLLGGRASSSKFEGLIAKSRRNSNYVVSSLGPHAYDLSMPAMSMGGMLFPTPITHHQILPAHIARAAIENVAFAIRQSLDLCLEISQSSLLGPFGLSGGFASGGIFCQILADVLNRPVNQFSPFGSSIGSAIIAGVDRSEWGTVISEVKKQARLIEPDVRGVIEYKEGFERWEHFSSDVGKLIDTL